MLIMTLFTGLAGAQAAVPQAESQLRDPVRPGLLTPALRVYAGEPADALAFARAMEQSTRGPTLFTAAGPSPSAVLHRVPTLDKRVGRRAVREGTAACHVTLRDAGAGVVVTMYGNCTEHAAELYKKRGLTSLGIGLGATGLGTATSIGAGGVSLQLGGGWAGLWTSLPLLATVGGVYLASSGVGASAYAKKLDSEE